MTEHPLFERENVVLTPHLGASTAEAQDRAGIVTAEQVRAALNGGVVTNAVNIPAVRPETMEVLAPFVALCEKLGRLAPDWRAASAAGSTSSSTAASPSTTRACSVSPCWWARSQAIPRSR